MATVRLLGEHISYSASPSMQTAAFAALGVDHRYEVADITAEELPAAVDALRDDDVLGANVTVPHKAAVIPLLDEIEPLAKRAGAVNTIVNQGGRLIGSNTDVAAIADEIGRLGGALARTVILGQGGAARAVAVALREMGAAEPEMVSRDTWGKLSTLLTDAALLINATPVGTNRDESPIDSTLLRRGISVLDLVYRPSPTRLVHDARALGLTARAGAGVLLGQGWRSLEAWLSTTTSPQVRRAMADALCSELGNGADV
jgi:shikimate dehydrogenase